MNRDTPPLGSILESFFTDYLKLQRGLRPNSIKSYADAWRLFLQFAAEVSGEKVTQLGLDDLHADAVSGFLASLEDRRHNAPQSRNQRLAAIRTFFNYVGRRFPDRLGQAQKVTTIPRKRALSPETVFLERDEIDRTLARLESGLPRRDLHALVDRYVGELLRELGAAPECVVLGCTHYPLVAHLFAEACRRAGLPQSVSTGIAVRTSAVFEILSSRVKARSQVCKCARIARLALSGLRCRSASIILVWFVCALSVTPGNSCDLVIHSRIIPRKAVSSSSSTPFLEAFAMVR